MKTDRLPTAIIQLITTYEDRLYSLRSPDHPHLNVSLHATMVGFCDGLYNILVLLDHPADASTPIGGFIRNIIDLHAHHTWLNDTRKDTTDDNGNDTA